MCIRITAYAECTTDAGRKANSEAPGLARFSTCDGHKVRQTKRMQERKKTHLYWFSRAQTCLRQRGQICTHRHILCRRITRGLSHNSTSIERFNIALFGGECFRTDGSSTATNTHRRLPYPYRPSGSGQRKPSRQSSSIDISFSRTKTT